MGAEAGAEGGDEAGAEAGAEAEGGTETGSGLGLGMGLRLEMGLRPRLISWLVCRASGRGVLCLGPGSDRVVSFLMLALHCTEVDSRWTTKYDILKFLLLIYL